MLQFLLQTLYTQNILTNIMGSSSVQPWKMEERLSREQGTIRLYESKWISKPIKLSLSSFMKILNIWETLPSSSIDNNHGVSEHIDFSG